MHRFICNNILGTKFPYKKSFTNKNSVKSMSSGLEEIVDVKGQIINYLKVGHGNKKVLCFPGALGSIWTDFKPQIKALDREKLTLIAWDPPGYGGSRPPMRSFGTNFYERDADTAYDFMQRLGILRYSLLGWSDGGISSLIMAGKYPKNIDKLVIWGAKSHVLPEDMAQYQKFRDISKWSTNMKAPLVELYTEEGLAKMWGDWCNTVGNILKNGGDICNCCLRNIKCPTLILYGSEDPMVSAIHPLYLFANIQNSKLYRFAGGKHNIHMKYSEEFNKIVTEFIFTKYCQEKILCS